MADGPEDEDVRQTFNFAPGNIGVVYRANVPDAGLRDEQDQAQDHDEQPSDQQAGPTADEEIPVPTSTPFKHSQPITYELKAMKWGLIPFWTKRSPDYGNMLKTINCRSDSLLENRGMWNTMKQRKRCIVVCQGFYEWLKKGPSGKEKVPHFVKRKDGELMCFAGLWDCAKYEGSDEKLYTYTIITTDSNEQLKFLHDRMPVILEANSEEMTTWVDPERNKWSKELQSILKPYQGELECYPVSQEVGKVGNNSPNFIVPIDSKENKKNIANFFGTAKAKQGTSAKKEGAEDKVKVEKEEDENRVTRDLPSTEDNAPLPVPKGEDHEEGTESKAGMKRERSPEPEEGKPAKSAKTEPASSPSNPKKAAVSPVKVVNGSGKKSRSATSNGSVAKSGSPKKAGDGSQRITNFFGK